MRAASRHIGVLGALLLLLSIVTLWSVIVYTVRERPNPSKNLVRPPQPFTVQHEYGLDAGTFLTTTTFPLHGDTNERGIHARLRNVGVVHEPQYQQNNAMLLVVVVRDGAAWGPHRTVEDFFALLNTTTIPKTSLSIVFLTPNPDEYQAIYHRLYAYISEYAQVSLIFRNDFIPMTSARASKYVMVGRYQTFAMFSALEAWHQHVVYLDPDIYALPTTLFDDFVASGRDIMAPFCLKHGIQYDKRTFVERPRYWRAFTGEDRIFQYPLAAFPTDEWISLDSVGSKLLYVRADLHRQGLTFPLDETDNRGLCGSAQVMGATCLGMPKAKVYHHYTDLERWTFDP